MYGLGPQKFLAQAAKDTKPGDTSQIQNKEEPGPANHPNTTSENTKMNEEGNQDMENNSDMNMSKAKVDGGEVSSATGPLPEPDNAPPEDKGFFGKLKEKVKAYVMRKGTEKMTNMMNPEGDNKSEGSKESNLANEQAPGENRPAVDKPQRPTRNDPKPKVPNTPPGPVNNTPTPKMPKAPRMLRPKIPRIR